MQSQTASEQGFVPESIFTKLSGLAVGTELEIVAMPEFSEHEEYGVQASIQTANYGTVQTNNRKTVGSLKSETENSLGDIIAKSLENGKALTVFVREEKANTGRMQKILSVY